jgi:AraC-like DNA-binding protein
MPDLNALAWTQRISKSANVSKDPLEGLLRDLNLDSVFYTRSELSAPWAVEMPQIDDALMFHMVVAGRMRLIVGEVVRELVEGDYVLLPRGLGHIICDDESSPISQLVDLPIESISEHYETLSYGGGGDEAIVICGAVCFSHPVVNHLRNLMPALVLIQTLNNTEGKTISDLLTILAQEALEQNMGSSAMVTKLADMLVIHAIRQWFLSIDESASGWLAAVQDPKIGKAVACMHEQAERPWTVQKLASIAGMSRTSFSNAFSELTDTTPLNYLMHWRMSLATSKLKLTHESILDIAMSVGYQSEAAFSRAYKKLNGLSPGMVRKS